MTFIRTLLTICTIVAISYCDRNKITHSRPETFFLQDSLFRIDVNVPIELDSFYTWVDFDHDDTVCEVLQMYRFSNSKYPIYRKVGFSYPTYPDSSYHLTFSHIYMYDCQDSEGRVKLKELIRREEERAKSRGFDFKLFSSESVNINGQAFDIIKFRTNLLPKQKYHSTLIWGFTRVDNIYLKVEYECASKNCDSFIERMSESLESIRVTKKN